MKKLCDECFGDTKKELLIPVGPHIKPYRPAFGNESVV